MNLGPLDFIVVRFPGIRFSGEIAAGLKSLTDAGTIRIVDLLFLVKDAQGDVRVEEITDLDDDAYGGWDPIVSEVFGYLTADDALLLADSLAPDSSAVLALVENTWALEMVKTIADHQGDVLISERIPRPVVDEFIRLH